MNILPTKSNDFNECKVDQSLEHSENYDINLNTKLDSSNTIPP